MTATPRPPRFVYHPEGGERQDWEFAPLKLPSADLEVVEDRTGMPYDTWIEAMRKSSVKATHGLLWCYLKRTKPRLEWEDVRFVMDEVGFEFDEGAEPAEDDDAEGGDVLEGKD